MAVEHPCAPPCDPERPGADIAAAGIRAGRKPAAPIGGKKTLDNQDLAIHAAEPGCVVWCEWPARYPQPAGAGLNFEPGRLSQAMRMGKFPVCA